MPRRLYARGKLLLTAEYVVLEGALALALPVKFGQFMQVEEDSANQILWIAREKGEDWFKAVFSDDLIVLETTHDEVSEALRHVLSTARILSGQKNLFHKTCVITDTDYLRLWGLGSSATLVALVAQYSGVNPYVLQAITFGGSGYDVACAFASGPVFYRRTGITSPEVRPAALSAHLKSWLYFVYSGRKQSSADEVARYKNLPTLEKLQAAKAISQLSERLPAVTYFQELVDLVQEHEEIIGRLIQKEPVQQRFSDFDGVVKSLGAWGGDFFLACSEKPCKEVVQYFETRGYGPVFSYHELIYEKEQPSQRNYGLID